MHLTLHLGRKCSGWGQLNAVTPSHILHLADEQSGRRFLIDTGAAFSIFPSKGPLATAGDLPQLRAAGGQSIACFGEKELTVKFSNQLFKWIFLLADAEAPIVGADFLRC